MTAPPPSPTPTKAAAAPTSQPAAATKAPAAVPATSESKAPEPTKAAAATPSAAQAPATAQALPKISGYPTRPLQMIIGWQAGNAPDVAGRLLADQLEKEIGQPVMVVNVPGASTQIGLQTLVSSKPDGYTFMYITVPTSVNVYMDPSRKANFSSKDFIAGPQVISDPLMIAVRADSKYKTIKDLAADMKSNPGKINAGDAGILTVTHMTILQFEREVGARLNQVHFNTSPEAVTAMLGGNLDLVSGGAGAFRAGLEAGQLRLLANASDERSKFYPNVPTFKESGYNVLVPNLHGIVWPKGTPPEITQYMEAAILKATKAQAYVDKATTARYEIVTATAEQFAKKIQDLEKLYPELSKLVPQ